MALYIPIAHKPGFGRAVIIQMHIWLQHINYYIGTTASKTFETTFRIFGWFNPFTDTLRFYSLQLLKKF